MTDFARRHYVRELRRAGGRILLFPDGMLHAKAMIVDERVALVGSANFDLRSLFVNFEIGVLVHSGPDVLAYKAWAEALMAPQCQEILLPPASALPAARRRGRGPQPPAGTVIVRRYSTASRSASQLASMTLSLTPTVPQMAWPSPLSTKTPGPAPRAPWLLSRMRTL